MVNPEKPLPPAIDMPQTEDASRVLLRVGLSLLPFACLCFLAGRYC